MTFLELLTPKIVPVQVTLPYGSSVTINMYTLSMGEWDELGESILDPTAPFVMHNSRGEEVRNYAAPQFLRERRKAESERAYRRLTMALIRGGNEIEGLLFENKVDEVRKRLDLAIASALMRWQASLIAEGRVRVINAADKFPDVEAVKDEDSPEDEDVSERVAKPR